MLQEMVSYLLKLAEQFLKSAFPVYAIF